MYVPISIYNKQRLTQMSTEEFTMTMNTAPTLIVDYFFSSESLDDKYEVIADIINRTEITAKKILSIIASTYHNSDYICDMITYIVKKYNVDVNTLNKQTLFNNPFLIKPFLLNGLDPGLFTEKIMYDLLHKGTHTGFYFHFDPIFVDILSIILNHNPMFLYEYFENENNCDQIINHLLYSYDKKLFMMCLDNGLKIGSMEFDGFIEYIREGEDPSIQIDHDFAIELIKKYRSEPEIFIDDAFDSILYLALKYSSKQTIEYIISSDITAEEIKHALNAYDNTENVLINLLNKFENEFDTKDIINLCIENRSFYG